MTVAADAFAQNSATFDDWVHTPAGTPAGVVAFIGSTTTVTATSYGASSFGEASGSPITVSGGELDGLIISAWFLGTSVPTGAQTISVTGPAGGTFFGCSYTVTAATDTQLSAYTETSSTSISNVASTLSLGGLESFCCEIWWSGENAVTSVSPLTNWTSTFETDIGDECLGSYSYNVIGTSDVTAGFTQTSDDAALVAVGIAEIPAAGGSVPPLAHHQHFQVLR